MIRSGLVVMGALASALGAACGFSVSGAAEVPADVQPPGDGPRDTAIDVPVPDTPEAPFACLETNDFCHRKRITIQPGMVRGGASLTNFPMLLALASDAELAATVRADGHDIEFTSSDGTTVIPHERQSYNSANGALTAWVNIPSLSNTVPTDIYMYYGKSSANDRQDANAAWSSTFHGVWHLDADAKDVSGNTNDGTNSGVAFNSPGWIGTAANWAQMTDRITINNSSTLDAVTASGTFEMWINFVNPAPSGPTPPVRYQFVLSNTETYKAAPNNGFAWATQANGAWYFYPYVDNPTTSDNFVLAPPPFMASHWHFVAVTYDFPTKTVKLFCDGQPLTLTTNGTAMNWSQAASVSNWFLGSNPDAAANYFLGSIDELRFSSVARTPGWLATEYANQSSPSTFYTVDSEQAI